MDYSKIYFMGYVMLITGEMNKRNIKFNRKYFKEIDEFVSDGFSTTPYSEHNNRYLKQCFYNLEEKHDRGIITNEEWDKIYNKFSCCKGMELWKGE